MADLKLPKFRKLKEDFVCEFCNYEVKGNGYTDHCPNCLWSRHVDINPGDRACDCKGAMKPIKAVYYREGNFKITYKCLKCGKIKSVHSAPDDNIELLEKLLAD